MIFYSAILLALSGLSRAKVQFLGVAIAGGDFGCQIDGNCPPGSAQLPLGSGGGGGDGPGQMKHFVQDDNMNIFRLPTSWQFLTSNNAAATSLNAGNLAKLDQLVQACFSTGAYCMIDIHNFARFNGQGAIIGQGGPTDDQFASLWGQLATKYASNEKVVFELMNEPHDLDVNIWAQTCQKAVAAIRNAGATSQMILLPGTNFDSAATLVSSGSADALMAVTNPDGTTDGLLLDVHKYLDVDNSGTHKECITDNVGNFTVVADYLRQKGRKGLVSETGASSVASCMTAFCAQNAFINANSDVFVGLVAWGAGSFGTDYVLSLTPSKSGNTFKDNALMSQCVVGTWLNSGEVVAPPPAPPVSSTTSGDPAATTPLGGTATTTVTDDGSDDESTAASTLVTDGGEPWPSPTRSFGGSPGSITGSTNSGSSSLFPNPAPTGATSGVGRIWFASHGLVGIIVVVLWF